MLDAADEAHPVAVLPAVSALSPDRIGVLSAFFQSEEFTSWVKALAAEEQAMLSRGVAIPGRKLVETVVRGNRRWISEEAVTQALGDEFGGELLITKVKSPHTGREAAHRARDEETGAGCGSRKARHP